MKKAAALSMLVVVVQLAAVVIAEVLTWDHIRGRSVSHFSDAEKSYNLPLVLMARV